MTTLTINDLAVIQELDAGAMIAVRGGTYYGAGYLPSLGLGSSKHDFSFDAQQLTQQTQDNFNATGNNAAFVSGISSTFKPTQSNSSTISF